MDSSLSNFELTDSTLKVGTDSENGSGSDKSEPIEILGYGDAESSSNKSEDDFDNNLPHTVTLLKHEKTGAKVYLIGTAHFSKESQEDVVKVIRNVLPHVVVLELCSSRTNILTLDEATVLEEARNIDMQKIIHTVRTNGLYNGLMYLLLLNMTAHITKEIGMAPGGEFRVAFSEASKIPNCGIHLGDRPINITLQRALSKLTWFQTMKLVWHLLTSKESLSVEDIEECKNRDMLEQLLAELAGEYPTFREVFLDERDIYLTNSLQSAAQYKLEHKGHEEFQLPESEPTRIVGIVGIGHVSGITKLWPHNQEPYLKDIVTIPPPSVTSKVIRYTFRVSLLAFGGYMIYRFIPVPKYLRENAHSEMGLASKSYQIVVGPSHCIIVFPQISWKCAGNGPFLKHLVLQNWAPNLPLVQCRQTSRRTANGQRDIYGPDHCLINAVAPLLVSRQNASCRCSSIHSMFTG